MEARKQAIADEFEKRKRAEKQAHEIVESLVNENVEQDYFCESLKKITSQHYDDIVEERSISSMCGYCLCKNHLKKVPQQQYKINKNRVYDITERKKFCSNRCFAISCKIREQISSTPLWLRDLKEIPDIKLPDGSFDLEGDEVHLRSVVKRDEIEGDQEHLQEPKPETVTIPKTSPHTQFVSSSVQASKKKHILHNEPISQKQTTRINVEEVTMSVLKEWTTPDTLKFLGINLQRGDKEGADSNVTMEETSLPKQLDRLELGSPLNPGNSATKPVPDFHSLNENVKKYEKKVEGFYGGSIEIKERHAPQKMQKNRDEETQQTSDPLLPIVDSKNQMAIRQKIVMDKIKNFIDGLTPPLLNVSRDLRTLVRTFRLTSKNVMLSTEIWPVMSFSLLNLISIKNHELRDNLESKNVMQVINILLKVYNLNLSDLRVKVFQMVNANK